MPFVTATDVQQLHAAIQSERSLLGMAVQSCSSLDAATITEWHALDTRVGMYLGDDPSLFRAAAQMDAGQQLQREMQPWHARLIAAGCQGVPAAPPPPPAMGGLEMLLQTVRDLAPVVLTIVVVRELHDLFGSSRR